MKPTNINTEKLIGIEFYSSNSDGIGGIIKKDKNDFKVVEDSDVERDEKGEHLCLIIEKEDLTTENVISILKKELNIDERFIGYAGNKDKNAITIQKISIHYSDEFLNKINTLSLDSKNVFKIIEKFRIKRKIRLGYLKGNFFDITVRKCKTNNIETIERIEKILNEISQNGVPNYFGIQRFGTNCDTHLYGKYLLMKEYEKLLEIMKKDNFLSKKIRNADTNTIKAVKNIPYFFLDIFIAGYQSYLFNKILSERVRKFGLEKMDSDFVNSKKEVVIPLIGYKSKFPTGEMGEIMEKVMEKEGITKEIFKHEIKFLSRKGDLRNINLNFKRFDYAVVSSDVRFKFWLEKGCYATVLMREFCKNEGEYRDLQEYSNM